jgi:hypothetical protein
MKLKTILLLGIMTAGSFSISAQHDKCPPSTVSATNRSTFGSETQAFAGQTVGSLFRGDNQHSFESLSSRYEVTKESYKQINGSPFLTEEAIAGTVIGINGNKKENVMMRVDLYSQNIIAQDEEGKEIALDGRFYKEIILPYKGKNLVFKKVNSDTPNKFYEVLYENGDMVFFKENSIKLKESDSASPYSNTETRFSKAKTEYYIKTGEEEIVKVKLKKKDILSVFPDAELEAMKYYAQSKGIKFKNESDYIAVFDGVNSQ